MYRRIKFTLDFFELVVDGVRYDSISIAWEERCSEDDLAEMNHWWLERHGHFTTTMTGLTEYGEVTLSMEPFGEALTK